MTYWILSRSSAPSRVFTSFVCPAVSLRYPQYNAVRFTFTNLFGFLLATAFWRVGMHR